MERLLLLGRWLLLGRRNVSFFAVLHSQDGVRYLPVLARPENLIWLVQGDKKVRNRIYATKLKSLKCKLLLSVIETKQKLTLIVEAGEMLGGGGPG